MRIDQILVRMLDVSKTSKDNHSPVCLRQVVDKVLENRADHLSVQQVRLVLDVDDDLPTLLADPLEVEQIFSYLIGNALQAMPEGGELRILLRSDMEKIYIEVADTGPRN